MMTPREAVKEMEDDYESVVVITLEKRGGANITREYGTEIITGSWSCAVGKPYNLVNWILRIFEEQQHLYWANSASETVTWERRIDGQEADKKESQENLT